MTYHPNAVPPRRHSLSRLLVHSIDSSAHVSFVCYGTLHNRSRLSSPSQLCCIQYNHGRISCRVICLVQHIVPRASRVSPNYSARGLEESKVPALARNRATGGWLIRHNFRHFLFGNTDVRLIPPADRRMQCLTPIKDPQGSIEAFRP